MKEEIKKGRRNALCPTFVGNMFNEESLNSVHLNFVTDNRLRNLNLGTSLRL